jgi:hypothetical protein
MSIINWSYLLTATDNDPRRAAAINPNATVNGSHTHTMGTPAISIIPNLGLGPNYQSNKIEYNTNQTTSTIRFAFNNNGSITITGDTNPSGSEWMEGTLPYGFPDASTPGLLTRNYLSPNSSDASQDIEIKFDFTGPANNLVYSVSSNANGFYRPNNANFELFVNALDTASTGTWQVLISVRRISNPGNVTTRTISAKVTATPNTGDAP